MNEKCQKHNNKNKNIYFSNKDIINKRVSQIYNEKSPGLFAKKTIDNKTSIKANKYIKE